MYNYRKLNLLKEILYIILISMLGCVGIVFSVLYIETFNDGFWYIYSNVIIAVSVSVISALTVLAITFLNKAKKTVYKLLVLFVAAISLVTFSLYFIKITGFLDKIDSVEDFREYISSFGGYAVVLFIVMQFLQVVILPIPSFITVGAGVLLFGAFKGSLFSCVGIILGSMLAFFLGRVFGVRIARWLFGEENLNKWLNKIKGKDKIALTFMFLFPFFPDDLLCFVCGITSMSICFFTIMIFVTRIITVFVCSYSMNNSIIPYNTWWGILLWIAFFVLTVVVAVIIYKKGERIESTLRNKFKIKKKKRSDN